MRSSFFHFGFTLLIAAGLSGLSLDTSAAEDSVKKRLDESRITYEIDKDGDFKLLYSYKKENRTQVLFVSGKTETLNGLVIREIFSPAAHIESDGIDGKKALELMANSRTIKLGSWEISGDVLYLVIKLPDSVSAAELADALDTASELADNMELKLTGKDEF